MDDEVRELRNKCAEALGWVHLGAIGTGKAKRSGDPKKPYCLSGFNDWWRNPEGDLVCGPCQGIPDFDEPAQAFELLCWLKCRGKITLTEHHFWFSIPAEMDLEYDAQGPAELRLALMRATVKVHEGRGK